MTARHAPPLMLAAATATLGGVAVWSEALTPAPYQDGPLLTGVSVAVVLVTASLGLLVLRHRPDNRVAWLLMLHACSLALLGAVDRYAYAGLGGELPLWEWSVATADAIWPLLFTGLIAIAFVFPDGRLLPGRRWRALAWTGVVSFGGAMILMFFSTDVDDPVFAAVDRPVTGHDALGWLLAPAFLGMFVTIAGAVASLVVRRRRARGAELQQVRWVTTASALIPVALGLGFLEEPLFGTDGEAALVAVVLAATAISAAVAVAISRHRLYELDRLVSRTLVYTALTGMLAAAYGIVSVTAGLALGGDGRAATALGTLAVALAFRPLRDRTQSFVDRRFDRARYEALAQVETFLAAVRDGRAEPEHVGEVLSRALGDPRLEVLFWLPESRAYVDVEGTAREPQGEHTPVARGGAELGVVLHSHPLRPDTLDAVLGAAGLAIEIARLRVEVRQQLAEVAQSRARIVAVGDEERRRLERDLHDGAQQRLVSIGLALRHAQHTLGEAEAGVRAQLDGAVDELTGAIAELRELSQGLRPAHLGDGLGPALQELARRAPLPVRVRATGPRCPEPVEVAAYFVISEALTNAIKHARASCVDIDAVRENGVLRLRVRDDGIGGAGVDVGSGLTGLSDRVAAHGGTLRVGSAAGTGTTIVVELPCAS